MNARPFEDNYASSCDCGGETLEWEWDSDNLLFKSTCSCMKQYSLTPVSAVLEVTDEERQEDDIED